MTARINEEIGQALREHGEQPIEVVDPATNRIYVVMTRERYERLKPIFEDEPLSREEQRHLLREAGRRAGWDDPKMEAYDRYDEEHPQQP